MSFLSRLFFKKSKPAPSATSEDKTQRLRALERGQVDAAALHSMAQTDSDPAVRKRALSLIDDPAVLLVQLAQEKEPGFKAQIKNRLKNQLLTPPRSALLQQHVAGLDSDLLEHIASHGETPAIRLIALTHIARPGFLGDRALADPDRDVRLSLIDRIESFSTLERIAKQSRTKDKTLHRKAREKLDSSKLAQGDETTLAQHAEALCHALEDLSRSLPSDSMQQLAKLDAALAQLARVPEPWANRFQNARATLLELLAPKPVRAIPEPIVNPIEPPVSAPEVTSLAADLSEPSAAEPSPIEQAKVAAAKPKPSLSQSALDLLASKVREFEKLVDAGDTSAARSAEKALDAMLQEPQYAARQPRDLQALLDVKAKLKKLIDWQRWSTNQSRRQLCDEAEALPSLALHPDALQSKVKELQQRWSDLDKLEGLSAEDAKALGIGKRFRALCFQALAPAKGFFEKRQAIREVKLGALDVDLAAAEALLQSESRPLNTLLDGRQKLSEHLRNLDLIDPAARKTASQRLRDLNAAYSQAIDETFALAEQEKRKLIAKLRRELIGAKPPAALEAAKSAQQAWKQMARGKRSVEDLLWNELRSLVDPLFVAQKSHEAAAQGERDARKQARDALIDEAKSLSESAQTHGGAESAIEILEQRWKTLVEDEQERDTADTRGAGSGSRASHQHDDDRRGFRPDREARGPKKPHDPIKLAQQRAFEQAIAAVQQHAQNRQSKERSASLVREQQLAELCIAAEDAWLSGTEFGQSWPADAQDKSLHKRFSRALDAMQAHSAPDVLELAENERRAEQLAMAIEYACKRESPAHLKAERMQYDIERLNQKHSARTEQNSQNEVTELMRQWRSLGPLRLEIRKAIQLRVDAAQR